MDVKTEKASASEGNREGFKHEAKKEGADQGQKGNDNQSTNKHKSTIHLNQGHEYKGENESIGVILALRSERFNHKVVFSSFTEKLKNYVISNFKDAEDIVPIVEELRDTSQEVIGDRPIDLEQGQEKNAVMLLIKTEQVKRWMRRLENLKNNRATLYGLVWGQLSAGLQETIKGELEYESQSKIFNYIWLLEKAKLVSLGVDDKANKYYTLLKALMAMCNIRQGQTESNDSFRKRIDSVVLTVNLVGGTKMLYSETISNTVDPDDPEEDEINVELQKLKAMLMILRSDPVRYGELQDSLLEGMHKGRDEFPTTVVGAYDLLQRISIDMYNHQSTQAKTKRFSFRNNRKVGNVLFTQASTTCTEIIPGKDGRTHPNIRCHNCQCLGHYLNQCPTPKKVTLAHFSLTQQKLELIDRDWILLDTCSTVSVFCNSSLVHNIRKCAPGQGLTVVTNGGAQTYDHTAEMEMLPLKVHFNTHSIANILSLSDVANLPDTKITMDTSQERAMLLHHGDKVFKFIECIDGLYYLDTNLKSKSTVSNYSFINTVEGNKSQFTKRDIAGADRAREIQGQLAWPSDTAFQTIVNNNLINNSPITPDDVQRATYIHGPAAPLLQGSTTRNKPTQVQVQKLTIPPSILQHYPNLQLYVDFFFVNNMPMLHTKTSKIDFLTVQTGKNRTTQSILKGLKSVINVYTKRGFNITDIHGDNEFDIEELKDRLHPANLHIYGKVEHVGTIERSIRTVKQRCRAQCHALPYR